MKPKIFLLFVFLLCLRVVVDTDFGWHLKIGEYIYQTKTIPNSDLFSFSRPGFPYIYHSWATELLIYLPYKFLGFWGVSLLYSSVLTLAFLFMYQTAKLISKKINYLALVWSVPIGISIAGGKTRVFGLLFFAIIYYLFTQFILKSSSEKGHNSKIIWFIPLVFMAWANFHGSFALGLVAFAVLSIFGKKRKTLFTILLLSMLATLINPFGVNIWETVLIGASQTINLRHLNPDWRPLFSADTNSQIIAILFITLYVVAKFLKLKMRMGHELTILIFLITALISSRFTLIFLVVFAPFLNQVFEELKNKTPPKILRSKTLLFPIIATFSVFVLITIQNLLEITFAYSNLKNYSQYVTIKTSNNSLYSFWPYNAFEYIGKNLQLKNIFIETNSSGFLLLQNPNRKLFYYGAMDNFVNDNNFFAYEYLSLIEAKDNWQPTLEKYDIHAIVLPPHLPLIAKLKNESNWQKVYEDREAIVFIK